MRAQILTSSHLLFEFCVKPKQNGSSKRLVKGLLEAEVVVSTETVRRRHIPVKPRAQPVASRSEGGGGEEGGRKCRRRREGDDGRGKCKSRASRARFITHLMTAQTMMTTGVAEQRRRAWVRLQRGNGMRCRGREETTRAPGAVDAPASRREVQAKAGAAEHERHAAAE